MDRTRWRGPPVEVVPLRERHLGTVGEFGQQGEVITSWLAVRLTPLRMDSVAQAFALGKDHQAARTQNAPYVAAHVNRTHRNGFLIQEN